MATTWKLSSITESENETLIVVFKEFWYQEDIETLTSTIFSFLSAQGDVVMKVETTVGADREYSRLIWRNIEVSLNFECYSQSCWFELEPQVGPASLSELRAVLNEQLV